MAGEQQRPLAAIDDDLGATRRAGRAEQPNLCVIGPVHQDIAKGKAANDGRPTDVL